MSVKEIVKNVIDSDYSTFRTNYKKTMKEEYNKNQEIVKTYVQKQISADRKTMI